MRRLAVIGTGPAAAGVCLALNKQSVNIHVFDVGEELNEPNNSVAKRLALSSPSDWDYSDIKTAIHNPTFSLFKKPQKLVFGSDYIYAQNRSIMSFKKNIQPITPTLAKGGFTRGWGGAVLPVSTGEFKSWPITSEEIEPHFRKIWAAVPLSGEPDEQYEEIFPRFGNYMGNIDLPSPCEKLLVSVREKSKMLDNNKFMLSRSRLMVKSGPEGCINCGLCLAGCPYGHIFQVDTLIDELITKGRIQYHRYSFVEHLNEENGSVKINIVNSQTRERITQTFDKVFVAAGSLGTTGIMLRSGVVKGKIRILNSDKFIFPIFLKSYPGFHNKELHTLPSLFADIQTPDATDFWTHGQISSISPLLELKWRAVSRLLPWFLMDRCLIMWAGLPSCLSSETEVSIKQNQSLISEMVPKDDIRRIILNTTRAYKRSPLGKAAIIIPNVYKYLPAGGHHYGGQFPMSKQPSGYQTDTLGRLSRHKNIHIVDTSIFPHIPATTIVLTLMANAHRIASNATK